MLQLDIPRLLWTVPMIAVDKAKVKLENDH